MRRAILLSATIFIFFSQVIGAGLTGVKNIPGDYATIAAAIAALNANGVGNGGVIFQVAAGHTETFASPTSGLITETGASAKPVSFIKYGSGANPLVTAGTGTGTLDGIIIFAGTDYTTFDGIDLQENSANTTSTTQMEWGYAALKKNTSSPYDGCQFVTIKNCTVTLNRTNSGTEGIHVANHTPGGFAVPSYLITTDANSNIMVSGCTIQNSVSGITFRGYPDSGTNHLYYDQNNTVYGCIIQNFGGSVTAYGVYGDFQNALTIHHNTVTNMAGGGSPVTGALYGIATSGAGFGDWVARYNTISLQMASSTSSALAGIANTFKGDVTISSNTLQNFVVGGGSVPVYFIQSVLTASPVPTGTLTADSNLIQNCTSLNTTGDINGIYQVAGFRNTTARHNTFSNIARLTAFSGKIFFLFNGTMSSGSGIETYTDNTISNISQSQAGNCEFYAFQTNTHVDQTKEISGNSITNITTGINPASGIYSQAGGTVDIHDNLIENITSGGTVYGIYTSSKNTNIFQNSIHGLSTASNTTNPNPPPMNGVYLSGATSATVYNNFITDLNTPNAGAPNSVVGIYANSATNINVYNNTLFITGTSSGTDFGTSGIYAATGPILDLRNNIVINTFTPKGTGKTVAYRRQNSTLTTYASTSNYNDFYAGTPGASNLIYCEGLASIGNAKQTIADYKAYVTPRDAASFSEFPPFVNSSSAPYDLHLQPTIGTFCESGGSVVTTPPITADFDNDPRYPNPGYPNNPVPAYAATAPDVGADEFPGVNANLSPPTIVYTPLGNTSQTTARNLTSTITDPNGVPTAGSGLPVLYWKINSGSYTPATAAYSLGTYTFNFGAGVAAGDMVSYYIVAQDSYSPPNVGAYPNLGAGGYTADPPAAATPPSNPSTYSIVGALAGGDYKIGGTGTTPCGVCQYVDLTAAFSELSSRAISGPINLILTSYYSPAEEDAFPLTLSSVQGSSATNRITLKPDAGLITAISGSSSSSVIKLNGADFVTIDGSNSGGTSRDLTISNTSTLNNTAVVWVCSQGTGQGATDITVKNCNLSAATSGTTADITFGIFAAGSSISPSGTGTYNDYLVIQNNQVTKAFYGIYAKANSSRKNLGLVITQNIIGSDVPASYIGHTGISFDYASGAQVTQNTIKNIIGTQGSVTYKYYRGIEVGTGVINSFISRNLIRDIQYTGTGGFGARGIAVTGTSSASTDIVNNAISGILGDGGAGTGYGIWGISVEGGSSYDIFYNSVSLTGDRADNSFAGILSGALLIGTSTSSLDIRNNIFLNTMTSSNIGSEGNNYAVYSLSANTGYTNIDYNDYFVNSATFSAGKLIGYMGAADQATLSDWRTATGKDLNSYWYNPSFTSPSDLTLTASNNGGTPIGGITGDLLDVTRDATNPDIGAYENSLVVASATWIGSTGTVWDDKTNWSPSTTIPNPSIHVVIPNAINMPVIPISGECKNLTVSSGAVMQHASGKWVTVWGNLVIQNGAELNNQGDVVLKGNLDNQNPD